LVIGREIISSVAEENKEKMIFVLAGLRRRGFLFWIVLPINIRAGVAVSALLCLSLMDASAAGGILKTEFIFERGPVPTNHASTIVETAEGLLAAWSGGPRARDPLNSIFSARSDGTNWTKPVTIMEGGTASARLQCWNPVLFQPSRGPLLLFYKVGPSPEEWSGMLTTSTNAGRTWTSPKRLPDGFIGPVRNKPMELPDGSLLCGASVEQGGWRVHMERASNFGERWEKTRPLNDPAEVSAIQPTILSHENSSLQILCRTKQGFIAEAWSKDTGKTWSALTLTRLPNPNGAIDALRLKDGRFLLVYNASASERNVLNLAASNDGRQWTPELVLEEGAGEFSYPAIIQARDGLVHITYSWNRQRIRHVIIDPMRFKPGP
jgi:predicted neuraminidase